MDRKSSVKDVHKQIHQAIPELYKKLCDQFGTDNPFAKFSVGAGFYSWSDNRCQWKQMVEASELEQSLICDSLVKLRSEISSKIGLEATELLFTIPDDSYIYYNDENGEIKILLTGWGFKKPARGAFGGDKIAVRKLNPISISFLYDGVKQRDYEFGIQTAKQIKRLKTDSNGVYTFKNLKVGEHFILIDFQNSKNINLDIDDGKSHYDFDVTRFTKCIITAVLDEKPLSSEAVTISCEGKTFEGITDGNGKAVLEIPFYDKKKAVASIRNQSKEEFMSGDDILFSFAFESNKPNPESTQIKVVVNNNGQSVALKEIVIKYGENKFEGKTDPNGTFVQSVLIKQNTSCFIDVEGYNSQSKELQSVEINEFVFDKKGMEVPDRKELVSTFIRVRYENGDIVTNYPISVNWGTYGINYITDNDGLINLSEREVGTRFLVEDGKNDGISKEYIVEPDSKEFLFLLPSVIKDDSHDIKLMFRDLNGNPITCDNIRFQQKEHDDVFVNLDKKGDTNIKEGMFKLDENILASINGWKSNEYKDIPFTLEKDEYEYLFQEEPSVTSYKWNILEILAVIAAAICIIIFWSFFEGFCSSMFNKIYM